MIREQIAEFLFKRYEAEYQGSVIENFCEQAEAILTLPSGLEAVRKCTDHTLQVWDLVSDTTKCIDCNGTGEIIRDLSIQETIDIMENIVLGTYEKYTRSGAKILPTPLYLPSGERVRLKKTESNPIEKERNLQRK